MAENEEQTKGCYVRWTTLISALVGIIIGVVLGGALILGVLPSKMIVTAESTMGFDETVDALQKAIVDADWVVSGVLDVNKSLANKGVDLEPQVKIVQLCNPKHAKSILTGRCEVSAMMPCSFGVWTADDGKVYVSKINTGLMAELLGGDAGRIMAGEVADGEEAILSAVVKQ
ncbi:MAG: DUF302 domain-containing protein [Planctomycetota bacterium]|jgi:uncharacterized protein (DUF302 family)